MAAAEVKNIDFYGVMGLKKECTPAELRNAYKKLAMVRIWNQLFLCQFMFICYVYYLRVYKDVIFV